MRRVVGRLAPMLLLLACAASSSAAKDPMVPGSGGGSGGQAGRSGSPSGGQGGAAGSSGAPIDATAAAEGAGAAIAPVDSAPGPETGATAGGTGFVVYLGTQTHLLVYNFDDDSGALVEQQRIAMGVRTVYAALSPDRKFLYASNGEAPGHVVAFAIDGTTGNLTRLNAVSTSAEGDTSGTSYVAVHPSGKWVMTAHVASGRVSVLPIGPGGMVAAPVDTRIFALGAHCVAFDRAGRFALVPVRDGGFIAQFLFDAATGHLTPNSPARVPSASGAGPRHIALHPSERFAYVNNESNGTVTAYGFDAAAGKLTVLESVRSVPAGDDETGMGHVAVHPSGKFVYASNRFHGSIAAYAVDDASGRLQLLEVETGDGDIKFPRDFALDPSGRRMVVGNERGDSLLVLRIDPDGKLSKLGAPVPTLAGPQVVVVLPLR